MVRHRHTVLVVILLAAALLRLVGLSSNPVALNQDEAVGGYDAFAIGETGRDHHGNRFPLLFESFEDWVSPTLTYLTVPFVKLLGLSVFSIRFVVGLAGTITVLLMYLTLRRFGLTNQESLTGAALLAAAPWHISLSRWAIPPAIVPFFLLLTIWLGLRAGEAPSSGRKWAAFILSAVALTYSYPTQKLFAPLLVGVLVVVCVYPNIKRAVPILLPYAAAIFPMYWMALRDPQRYNARFNSVALNFHAEGVLGEVAHRYYEYWSADFLFGRGDQDPMHHVPGFGAMSVVIAFFFFLGIVLVAARAVDLKGMFVTISRRSALFLLAWLLLFPLPASLTQDHMHLLRAVHGLPATIVFAAVGLSQVLRAVSNAATKVSVLGVLSTAIVLETAGFCAFYFGDYREQTADHFQFGLKGVYDRALAMQGDYDEVRVSTDINTPYIFYLFFSARPPSSLDYRQINEHVDGSGNWLWVSQVDKWRFTNVSEDDLRDAKELFGVKWRGRVWHRLFAKGRSLIIK